MDKLIRGITENKEVRFFATETTELVKKSTLLHETSPVASAALGRLLTAGVMMGNMLKGDKDLMTINIKGDGPLKNVLVTANNKGQVKGYVANPYIDMPLKENGKLDVSGAIGRGTLNIINDYGLKEPYSGTIELVSGEIAEDITYYYASSEQTPSVVALGVLTNSKDLIKVAGGFIIQLMPFATEETISKIEENIKEFNSITNMLEEKENLEEVVNTILKGLSPIITDELKPEYKCNCSRERVERAVISVGNEELQDMIEEGNEIEIKCHFCNEKYKFSIEELKEMLN